MEEQAGQCTESACLAVEQAIKSADASHVEEPVLWVVALFAGEEDRFAVMFVLEEESISMAMIFSHEDKEEKAFQEEFNPHNTTIQHFRDTDKEDSFRAGYKAAMEDRL